MAFNFGVGLGAFAQGIMQGMQLGKMYNDANDQYQARKTSKDAMDAAQKAHDDAVSAQMAKTLGLGPSGPQGPTTAALMGVSAGTGAQPAPDAGSAPPAAAPDASTPNVTTQPVDMNTPQASPLPDNGAPPAGAPTSAPPAAAPTPAPTTPPGSLSPGETVVPPDAMRGTPMANSGSMAPAPTPAQAVSAANTVGASQKPGMAFSMPASSGLAPNAAPVTPDQARSLAEKSVPSVMDFFMKKGVPMIAQKYLEQGNPEKAQAWLDWSDKAKNQKAMQDWANAVVSPDFDTMADRFGKYYTDHINDGVDYVGHKIVTKDDGTQVAVVKLKENGSDKITEMELTRDKILALGGANNPQKLFEMAWQNQQAVDAAKAKSQQMVDQAKLDTAKGIAVANAREGARGQNELTLQKQKANDAQDLAVAKGAIDAKNQQNKVVNDLNAKVSALKQAGYSDDFINNALPSILGVNQDKKSTSPQEARRLAFSDRMKNDPTFSTQSADKQRQIIDGDMNLIFGGLKPSDAPSGASGGSGTTANPFNGTGPASRGLPVLDTKTGKIVYR